MFHIGQKVVCINDDPDRWGRPIVVVKGQIYTVSKVFRYKGIPAILLVEVCPGLAPGWHARRFRPVQERKTDISVFTQLLTPVEKKEMEPA